MELALIFCKEELYGAIELLTLNTWEAEAAVLATDDPEWKYIAVDVFDGSELPVTLRLIPCTLTDPEYWNGEKERVNDGEIRPLWVGIVEEVEGEKVPLTTLVTNNEAPPFSK